ncbi:Protein of unknown function [Catalinimonas alkaloidigena]|uniref:DUF3823 domain-containing protein n=1 Tax=Catalinimonas alkaloidigena TaxID=1075417 RepID=A0A1G9TMM3_9BACT|nr:DUF3823 domain-containing protein [Catalinimonas alkaloidigena]SDM48931.1 Protein of unknown function [Catalinimonas alkaloidigena]
MKIFSVLLLFAGLALFTSCELNQLDNYDPPTAGLYGRFIDEATGEPVEQDIIRGTVIELIEHGYDPVTPQYLIVKNDGSYANTRLFANTYTVQPVRGNFKVVEAQEVKIEGQTELNFLVTPYIRVKEATITREGDLVTATFKLEQTSVSNVLKVGLYAHPDPHVGEPMHLEKEEQNVSTAVDPNQVFTLEMDLSTTPLESGTTYFFRIGALIDVPEAKYNYAPAVAVDY